MSVFSDRDLITRAQTGEVGAFATLVGRSRDVYTRFAIRMLGGYEVADEALQAAFVRAFQSMGRIKEPDQFADWVFRFVINECRSRALRRVVRERATGEVAVVGAAPRPLGADAQAMQRVVDQIDPVLREPFVLLYVEELPYVRIAALTGMPVQTLERQVDKACARLREIVPPASQDTQLSSVGLELLSSEPTPSLAVQVALPLRRPEVLNDSFEDRLMAKLLRAVAVPDSGTMPDAAGSRATPRTSGAASPPPPSPWTLHNEPTHGPLNRRLYLAVAGVGACLALAAFITGYAARRWRDVKDVERRRPTKPAVATRIVRRTDTVRVVRRDTIVMSRFAFVDEGARSVSLVGDFNDWNPSATPLQPGAGKGAWSALVSLAPGRHEYAFIVDGKRWALDRFTRSTHEESGVTTSIATFGDAESSIPSDAASARSRLEKVLPRDVSKRVLETIAKAKEQGLPSGTLEQTALKLAVKRLSAKEIEHVVSADADRLVRSRHLLATSHAAPTAGEVLAGADALRQGGDSTSIVELASAVPAHRSVAVPLGVLGQLIGGGMNAQEAADKIRTRVHNDATDAALQHWADETLLRLASAEKKGTSVAQHGRTTDVHQAGAPKNGGKKGTDKKKTTATSKKPARGAA